MFSGFDVTEYKRSTESHFLSICDKNLKYFRLNVLHVLHVMKYENAFVWCTCTLECDNDCTTFLF